MPNHSDLDIRTFQCNALQENTFVVSNNEGHALIIDCGATTHTEREAIRQYISEKALTPVAHVLTHAHFDHIFGAQFIFDTYGLKPRFHAADTWLYTHAAEQWHILTGQQLQLDVPPAGPSLTDGSQLPLGQHVFSVIHTPGHTEGGVCLYCAEAGVLFTGDTLFRGSIGRTDLPGGSYPTLVQSLTSLFGYLPGEVVIYPGHGPTTDAAYERKYNPFL